LPPLTPLGFFRCPARFDATTFCFVVLFSIAAPHARRRRIVRADVCRLPPSLLYVLLMPLLLLRCRRLPPIYADAASHA